MFIRPNGSVTGSILVADLPDTPEPAKKRGRPRKAAAEEAAANPEPPQPEPQPIPVADEPVTAPNVTYGGKVKVDRQPKSEEVKP